MDNLVAYLLPFERSLWHFHLEAVNVAFFWDSAEAIMPDTIKRFLEVNEFMKVFFLMFQVLLHQLPQVLRFWQSRVLFFVLKEE